MTTTGQKERATQNRVIALFQKELGYRYWGNWADRETNSNIETGLLTAWLTKRGYSPNLIGKALYEFGKTAGDQSKSLYDVNKAVYALLRYGVNVQPEIGQNKATVWLIDWQRPLENDFAIAEEVTIKGLHKKRPDLVLYINGIAAVGVLELKRSLQKGRERLDEALEAVKALCEAVEPPQDTLAHIHYFCGDATKNPELLKDTEPRRVAFYKLTLELIRAYANVADEMPDAGYTDNAAARLKHEVKHFEALRQEIMLASGDYVDLKQFEPAMRHLIDSRPGTPADKRHEIMTEWYRRELKAIILAIAQKRIWLNLELAKKPVHCLEYIIVHEIVHLLERHHNDKFLAYLKTYLPNWKQLKAELNAFPVSHADWAY